MKLTSLSEYLASSIFDRLSLAGLTIGFAQFLTTASLKALQAKITMGDSDTHHGRLRQIGLSGYLTCGMTRLWLVLLA